MKKFIKYLLITMAIAIGIDLIIVAAIYLTIPALKGICPLLGIVIVLIVGIEVYNKIYKNKSFIDKR